MRKTTIRPITALISSTIPENQHKGVAVPNGKWAAGTHTLGQIVYYDGVFPYMVYECLTASTTTTPGTDAAIWGSKGAIDQHLLVDPYLDTFSFADGSFEFEIDASNCDAVGLFRLQAKYVEMTLIVDDTDYDYKLIDLDASNITDWYEYDTAGFDYKENLIWYFDRYSSSKLKIKISYAPGDLARCGIVGIGESRELGKTVKSPSVSIDDYSIVNVDGLGTYLKPGTFSDIGDFEIIFPAHMTDIVKRSVVESRGKAAMYDFNNSDDELFLESLLIYGLPERFEITPEKRTKTNMDYAKGTFSMKGMP